MSRPWYEAEWPSGLTLSPGPESEDDLLDAAFELAHFLHHDREIARTICLEAMQRLEIAAAAQVKRLYYRPLRQNRFRASWGDRHLLQRLVYFHSEKWERLSESREPESLTEEDLLLRFWKHLSQITMKRNSFYAAIALGRIVHAYSTAETMEIYHAIAPEDCERKQSDYLRSRKAQLLEEVRGRFEGLLTIVRGPHQEDRIETREANPAIAAWARECLRVLTPWAVPCWGRPESRGAAGRRRNRFASDRDESSREARRFHALFDPPCFARVARSARLAEPAGKLAIPRFQAAGAPPSRRGRGEEDRRAHLMPEERAEIQRQLAEEARRRRELPTRFLRILVDGRERARIDPRAEAAARLSLEDSAEMIEVRVCAPAGEVPLAVHALSDFPEDERAKPATFSIELEAGQALSFRVEPGVDSSREIEVSYRETDALRKALLAARRTAWQLGHAARAAGALARQPAAVLLLLGTIGLWFTTRSAPGPVPTPHAAVASARVPAAERAEPAASPAIAAPVSLPSQAGHRAAPRIAESRPRTRPLSQAPVEAVANRLAPSASPAFNARFTLSRARLLRTSLPVPAAAATLAVSAAAESPLDAVRRSFVERLGESEPETLAAVAAPPDRTLPIFERAFAPARAEPGGDLRTAAYQAALSSPRPVSAIAPPALSSRRDDASARIPVIRQLGASALPDTGCRQPDFSCGSARIAPVANRSRQR